MPHALRLAFIVLGNIVGPTRNLFGAGDELA